MKTVLITGFEPFGGERINPSQEIARALDGRVIAGRPVVGAVLPCAFGTSLAELRRLLRSVQPEARSQPLPSDGMERSGPSSGRSH